MIHVLQIGLGSNFGGIENCILNYFRHIDRKIFSFDFIDMYGKGLAYSAEIKKLGGKIYELPSYKKHPLIMAYKLQKIIEENNYDIVHINMLSAANIIPVLIVAKYNNEIIIHAHNTSVPSGMMRRVMNWFNVRKLRRMTVEKWGCSILAGKWMWGDGFDAKNVMPNAVDTKEFVFNPMVREKIRKQNGLREDDIVIGFVGRLSEQKNVLFLPEILFCLKHISEKYKLLLVGDGNLRKKLEKKVAKMDLGKEVFWAGLQSNTSQWYQAMDVFVLPSLFEGLPVVGVEAQAVGLPCFFSEQITEEIALRKNVYFLPINKGPYVWANAIHKRGTEHSGKNGVFPEKYDISYASKRLEDKYKEIVGIKI